MVPGAWHLFPMVQAQFFLRLFRAFGSENNAEPSYAHAGVRGMSHQRTFGEEVYSPEKTDIRIRSASCLSDRIWERTCTTACPGDVGCHDKVLYITVDPSSRIACGEIEYWLPVSPPQIWLFSLAWIHEDLQRIL
jgi:hypothetical protein